MDILISLAAGLLLTAGIIVAGLLVLVLSRPPRRTTTDKVLLSKAKTAELDADWKLVREMEHYCYGAHYHRRDGTTHALGWESLAEEEKAQMLCSGCGDHVMFMTGDSVVCPYCGIRQR